MKKYIVILCLTLLLPINHGLANTDHYGAPFDDSIPLKTIGALFESADLNGKILSFQGTVSAQCKSDGCWFKLKDSTGEILVDLKPYDFRTPMEIVGKKIKINGKVNSSDGKTRIDAISVIILG